MILTSASRARSRRLAAPAALILAVACAGLLSGCAQSSPATGGSGGAAGGGSSAAGSGGAAKDCSAATTPGYEVFLDPALKVEPKLDVYPMQKESDTIKFTYTGDMSADPGFSWTNAVIQGDKHEVAPQNGAPFFDEQDGVFSVSGLFSTVGITGGPYPGFLDVTMTSNVKFDEQKKTYTADTKVIGRLCVIFEE